ncbi:MYND-type domain-containing protein [Mycena indigotica]|uniref:MYND-type domain-containing protein n=1 Tax=Mycena indigotica TaxID=2126181 RepID=A0A8H6SLD3_9AGAR|nr:MYND-type domain-containing protein [Mycena indigotica]KAF7300952.1 MYND-type domain-containing protein [Mycena indigotica]
MARLHPLLRVENVEKLPFRLRLHAKRALVPERTTAGVEAAANVLKNINEADRAPFIPVFYTILRSIRIPSVDELAAEWISGIEHAWHALYAVCFLVEMTELPDSHDLYAALWVCVWPWVCFFQDQFDLRPECRSFFKASLLQNFIIFSSHLSLTLESHSLMLMTPGFRTIIAAAWCNTMLTGGPTPRDDEGEKGRLARVFSIIFVHFLSESAFPAPNALQEIIEGTGGTVHSLGSMLSEYMKTVASVDKLAIHPQHTESLLMFLDWTDNIGELEPKPMISSPSSITLVAVQEGLIDHVVDTLCLFITSGIQSEAHVEHPRLVEITSRAFWLIVRVSMLSPGLYGASQKTLGSRLLRILALCARHLSDIDELQASVARILRTFMLPMLLDVYAIQHLPEELAHAKQLVAEAELASNDSELWKRFFDVAEDRLSAMQLFDLSATSKICGNLLCHLVANRTQFRRCQECKDAWYCSTDCQREDWKLHKKLCRHGGGRSLGLATHGFRQRCYMRDLLDREYQHHKSIIYEKYFDLMLKNPRINLARVVVHFNFNSIRSDDSVEVTVKERGLENTQVDEWTSSACEHLNRRAERAEASNTSFQLHQVHLPYLLRGGGVSGWSNRLTVVPLRGNDRGTSAFRAAFDDILGSFGGSQIELGEDLDPEDVKIIKQRFVERILEEKKAVVELH